MSMYMYMYMYVYIYIYIYVCVYIGSWIKPWRYRHRPQVELRASRQVRESTLAAPRAIGVRGGTEARRGAGFRTTARRAPPHYFEIFCCFRGITAARYTENCQPDLWVERNGQSRTTTSTAATRHGASMQIMGGRGMYGRVLMHRRSPADPTTTRWSSQGPNHPPRWRISRKLQLGRP